MSKAISLRALFALLFAILIVGLTVFFGVEVSQRSTQEIRSEAGKTLSETAQQLSKHLEFYMWSRYHKIDLLSFMTEASFASSQRNGANDLGFVDSLFKEMQRQIPDFSWMGFADQNGIVRIATGDMLIGEDISQDPAFAEGIKGSYIGDVHGVPMLEGLRNTSSGERMQFVGIGRAVHGPGGEAVGVVVAFLNWEWVAKVESMLLGPIGQRRNLQLFILNGTDGTILLGPTGQSGSVFDFSVLSGSSATAGEMSGIIASLLQEQGADITRSEAQPPPWSVGTWPDGIRYLSGFATGSGYDDYPGLGWMVVIRQPEQLAFASGYRLGEFILLTGTIAAVLFAIFGWIIAGPVTAPLRRITDAADRLRGGERVAIPKLNAYREVQVLSESLSALIGSLTSTEVALDRIERIATHDRLTDLPNRRGLEEYIGFAVPSARRSGTSLIVFFLDLDGFKDVNDILGHAAGDDLLLQVGRRFRKAIREGEIVARVGGDEFIIVCTGNGGDTGARAESVAARVLDAVSEPFAIEGKQVKVGCSIGAAVWPKHGDDFDSILRLADESMYAAKRSDGRHFVMHGKPAAGSDGSIHQKNILEL